MSYLKKLNYLRLLIVLRITLKSLILYKKKVLLISLNMALAGAK